MTKTLHSNYIFNEELNLWGRLGFNSINYSDGNEIEDRLANIIKSANDVSVLSTELRQHCTDWPSLYHLCGSRANILRPFEDQLKGNVLEIGSGCGAITRYLGEIGADVLALEGSIRRASITRSRTRDLPNVTVLSENFDQFESDQKFDVITLIGVLEYANLFTPSDNPHLTMLKQVQKLLKPKGKLIIAIENQLGLKYFAGALEDHLGKTMLGIEGRYLPSQPQTFGRVALTKMLNEAKFNAIEFLAPFPDYKLPVSVVTEHGFSTENFDAAAFAWQSIRRDPQLPSNCNFSLELAWPEVIENGLGLDMANSFLIVASPSSERIVDSKKLAFHYSTERASEYCKETKFEITSEANISLSYRKIGKLVEDNSQQQAKLISFKCPDSDKYQYGQPMSWEFVKLVTCDNWSIKDVVEYIKRYITLFEDLSGIDLLNKSYATMLPGEFYDCVPHNIIISKNNQAYIIDTEWVLQKPIELGFLVFRGLFWLLNSVSKYGINLDNLSFTRIEFVKAVLLQLELALSEQDVDRYLKLEAEIQQEVVKRPVEDNMLLYAQQPCLAIPYPPNSLFQAYIDQCAYAKGLNAYTEGLNIYAEGLNAHVDVLNKIAESRFNHIKELSDEIFIRGEQLAERDEQLAERDEQLAERDEQLAETRQGLIDAKATIDALINSSSWKITKPIRYVSGKLKVMSKK